MFAPEWAVVWSSPRSGWFCVSVYLSISEFVGKSLGTDVWGELVPPKTCHHSQFSRLGIQCPTPTYVMFVGRGWIRWVSSYSFLKFCLASVQCTCFSCTTLRQMLRVLTSVLQESQGSTINAFVIYPQRACAVRVTVLGLCLSVCVCLPVRLTHIFSDVVSLIHVER